MESPSGFKIVIAYETIASAVRAKEMSERLLAELNSQCEVWSMDSLVYPPLRQLAIATAAQADMVIIAARGRTPLPTHINEWIEEWLPKKKPGPTALVALIEAEATGSRMALWEPPPLCAYLGQIAERGGMDFFSNAGDRRVQDFQNVEEIYPQRTEDDLAEVLHHDPSWRGWGIND